MSYVTVVADENHNVINVSKNPEFGYIRLKQETVKIGRGGWLRFEKRSALLHGKIEDLKKANYGPNQQLPGQIVVKESFTPFNDENPDRDLKIAGKTGIILKVDDQPIYRTTVYTTDMSDRDELIQHDAECTSEIREVLAAQKAIEELGIMSDTEL